MQEISQDRGYPFALLVVFALSIPLALLMALYLWTYNEGIDLVWETIPDQLDVNRRLYTVLAATTGGLLVAIVLRVLGSGHGEKPLQQELLEDGRTEYRRLPSMMAAATIGLSFGASLGPEAPLAHLGGGVGTWVSERLRYSVERTRMVALSGVSTAFSGLFSTPIGGSFMSFEFTGLLRLPIYYNVLGAIVGGLGGYIVITEWLGVSANGLFPFEEYQSVRGVDYLYALAFGGVGVALAVAYKLVFATVQKALSPIPPDHFSRPIIGGLAFGLIGAWQPLTLFSGEHETHDLIENADETALATLLLLFVLKLVTLSICMSTGFPGGFIFPILFSATALGLAIEEVIPAIPLTVAVVCMMAASAGSLMRMPICVIVFLTVLTRPDLAPLLIVSAITGYLIVTYIPFAGNARKDLAKEEAGA